MRSEISHAFFRIVLITRYFRKTFLRAALSVALNRSQNTQKPVLLILKPIDPTCKLPFKTVEQTILMESASIFVRLQHMNLDGF